MSTTRAKSPYKLEVTSADGSQTGSALTAEITNAGVVDVEIPGNLTVSGTTQYNETTNLKIDDAIIELNKGNSGGSDEDSGILIQRGSAGNNAAMYWNEGEDKFKMVLTTSGANDTSITDSSTATLVANIEGTVSGGVTFDGVDITGNEINSKRSNEDLELGTSGTGKIVMNADVEFGQITIAGNEIFSNSSNADIKVSASASGQIHLDDFTKLTAQGSDPVAVTGTTHFYAKTESGGGTGLFYVNTSSSGELVSKAKAQIFGLIF
jgi:hypothetical protein